MNCRVLLPNVSSEYFNGVNQIRNTACLLLRSQSDLPESVRCLSVSVIHLIAQELSKHSSAFKISVLGCINPISYHLSYCVKEPSLIKNVKADEQIL